MSHDLNIVALAPRDDLPYIHDPSFGVYDKALSSAFLDPKIRNLALSGSLGSGKSSIIRSFDRQRNGTQRFLYVSLIDFAKAVPGADKKAYDQQQLEYSLLSQIQSYCTYDAVPEGSVRGIPEKYRFLKLSAGLLSLLVLTAFVLIFHEKFGALAAMLGFPGTLRGDLHLLLYLFAALVLCGCTYCILRRCLPFLRVSKLLVKSSMAEAEVNLSKEQFSLDTHKFELAYILEQIGKAHDHTVVFEDLERLDPAIAVSIMTKLRELNTLTNNHILTRKNARPIRFLYAIADSTMPAEYRTKFYDCIIPVIPVSHPLNSKERLQNMLKRLKLIKGWEDHLCDALSDVFVDHRTLLSLWNEFQVLQALYKAKTEDTNGTASATAERNAPFLFAITAYKVLLPEIFEEMLSPQGDGILPDIRSPKNAETYKDTPQKIRDCVHKLFDSSLLDKTSMRLIIGEKALIEQWLKVIRYALDKEAFDTSDEMRIRDITDTLQLVFMETRSDPYREPYAEFRKAMYERLCTLIYKKDQIQFILLANSLAAVSRADTESDWNWVPSESTVYPVEFPGFLRNYLGWLDALSEGPEPKVPPHAMGCLKALCEMRPEYQVHILQWATELSNSSGMPNTGTIARLKDLWDACPKNPEVALQCAKALVKLANEQGFPECADTIALLYDLHEKYPDDPALTLEYAKGLVNLSSKQQLPECAHAVELLKNLHEKYPDGQAFAFLYAKGLFFLSLYQPLPKCANTVDLLKNLHEKYPDSQEITLLYAEGLVNLSLKQRLPESADTIALLKNLHEKYPDHNGITQAYEKGLENLARKQRNAEIGYRLNELQQSLENNHAPKDPV